MKKKKLLFENFEMLKNSITRGESSIVEWEPVVVIEPVTVTTQ